CRARRPRREPLLHRRPQPRLNQPTKSAFTSPLPPLARTARSEALEGARHGPATAFGSDLVTRRAHSASRASPARGAVAGLLRRQGAHHWSAPLRNRGAV